jgi:uroporphyrinogen decarboxylase
MSATSRELVYQTLEFRGPARAPRQVWALPWADIHHGAELARIREEFPEDFAGVPGYCSEFAVTKGNPTGVGTYVDDWGSVFTNLVEGIIGEVKDPLVNDWETDAAKVHIPREWLTINPDKINAFCAESDKFCTAGCCPRPFEQLQFLRGTVNLYMDLMAPEPAMRRFMSEMHAFYCELLEKWAKTDVDGLMFMDDWGSQQSLLISPDLWREHFRPLYKDYIDIAHGAGKKIFMHSDGYTIDMFPDLVELGLDAINSQIFCMGLDTVAPFAGKITFWGEIDRQHILPEWSVEQVDQAVREVHAKLWKNGGCFAQCEFGMGSKPENVRQVFASWDALAGES